MCWRKNLTHKLPVLYILGHNLKLFQEDRILFNVGYVSINVGISYKLSVVSYGCDDDSMRMLR